VNNSCFLRPATDPCAMKQAKEEEEEEEEGREGR